MKRIWLAGLVVGTFLTALVFAVPGALLAQTKQPPDKKIEREPDVRFVPTPFKIVDRMLRMADVHKGDTVYDLGCGDGRILVAAAKKYGAKGIGFDIDPDRVKDSIENVRVNDVEKLVTIKQADIFTLDLSGATVITLYLLPELNLKLIPQLEKLKPGCRIVSHAFGLRGVKPKAVEAVTLPGGVQRLIYLWVTPLEKEKP